MNLSRTTLLITLALGTAHAATLEGPVSLSVRFDHEKIFVERKFQVAQDGTTELTLIDPKGSHTVQCSPATDRNLAVLGDMFESQKFEKLPGTLGKPMYREALVTVTISYAKRVVARVSDFGTKTHDGSISEDERERFRAIYALLEDLKQELCPTK